MSAVFNIIRAKSIYLRLVSENDAEFICSLRNNKELNPFISTSSDNVEVQKLWIQNYKKREAKQSEYYFIISRNIDNCPIGTVRLYDFLDNPKSFCWGSWILNSDKTASAALESALLVYILGFDILGFDQSHYDVMLNNHKVHSFHTKMGAINVANDDKNKYYIMTREAHQENLLRYQRLLKGQSE